MGVQKMGLSYRGDRSDVSGDTRGMRLSMRLAVTALLLLAVYPATAEDQTAPYPLEQWAMRDVISSVSLSPNGEQLALLKIPTRDGDPVVEIYDAGDLSKEPFRMNADRMELTGIAWLNDEKLFFGARQAVRDEVEGRERDVYRYRSGLLDVKERKIERFDDGFFIEELLPKSPNKVILAMEPPGQPKLSELAKRRGAFGPLDYYEFDLEKGTRKLLVQGRLALGNYGFDSEGVLWSASGQDQSTRNVTFLWRPTPGADWQEYYRRGWDDWEFDRFLLVNRDDMNANHAYVRARNGYDTMGMWSYDMQNKRFAEAIFRHPQVDVNVVLYHSNGWEHPDTVVGVGYVTDRRHVEFFDESEAALYKQLEGAIPGAHDISVSRSRDGATLVAYNSGPRDPGTYYLLKGGKLETIGSRQPLFASENLAEVEFVKYEARDGRDLFAYVTMPKGKPPFPLVVMPHGGPAVRDPGGFDKWAQLLANYGYLVVQPQYRGSNGFGRALREAAFEDGGQSGHKMQDDKDDAALHLVAQGLADEKRMAMFGWSYGGYAAAVAASRTPQLYQCTIAGAGVFDRVLQFRYDRRLADGEFLRRYVAYEEKSVNPVDEVEKVNVPMLIVHGVVDHRVLLEHATEYVELLEEHDKPHKYVKLEGAGHFYGTLFYDHQLEFFGAMLDFLANDCGPGGL